jgi:hypothetical protein
MPDHGTLIAWSQADGVGKILLDAGDEVRVGQTAFRHLQPTVGHRWEVVDAEPHPLGGRRATRVELLDEPKLKVAKVEVAKSKELGPWLLERVRSSSRQPVAHVEVQNLIACHQAFSGNKAATSQVFGIDPRTVERSAHKELLSAIETELKGWRDRLTSPLDQFHLDKAGRRLGLSFLRMQLPKLRCEPLGTTDGLDAGWQRRISFLREAVRGKRKLQLGCLEVDEEKMVMWGKPDRDALYEAALSFEVEEPGPFPRGIAAMVSVADGVSVGATSVLAPIAEWVGNVDGLQIGSGSYFQGNLTLIGDAPLLERKLIDRDDDGVELHAFANLGAFLDALLGVD